MKRLLHITFTVIVLIAPLYLGIAQGFRDSPNGPASDRLKQLKRIKMIEALDLTEEQSVRLFARENEHRNKHKQITEDRKAAIRKLHKAVQEGASDEALLNGIDEVFQIDEQLRKSRKEYILSLTDILSVQQIAKMVVFEQRFAREVREILESLRDRKGPPKKRRK